VHEPLVWHEMHVDHDFVAPVLGVLEDGVHPTAVDPISIRRLSVQVHLLAIFCELSQSVGGLTMMPKKWDLLIFAPPLDVDSTIMPMV
jgi:hypothetical protein